jgi:ATP-dependent DNA helicase RecG
LNHEQIIKLVERLSTLDSESEWLEFKMNNDKPDMIGEYISAIANSACLCDRRYGYLIFGVTDDTHEIIGTEFNPLKSKIGNEDIEPWLYRMVEGTDFSFFTTSWKENHIVVIKIDAAMGRPARFKDTAFV